jgi:hypothetical protein
MPRVVQEQLGAAAVRLDARVRHGEGVGLVGGRGQHHLPPGRARVEQVGRHQVVVGHELEHGAELERSGLVPAHGDLGGHEGRHIHPGHAVVLGGGEAERAQEQLGPFRRCLRGQRGEPERGARQDGPVERRSRPVVPQQRQDGLGSRRLARQRDLGRVAAEPGDVVAHPPQGGELIM